jgi:glycosyltransferase involved in cell wall biosynthesis
VVWLVDISRLVENLHYRAPTGIDRVELAYARYFLGREDRQNVRFVVTWPSFSGLLSSDQARTTIEQAAATWSDQENDKPAKVTLATLWRILTTPILATPERGVAKIGIPDRRTSPAAIRTASVWFRSMTNRLSRQPVAELRAMGACYLHVSQFRLNRPRRFRWLTAASARSGFLLHDLIPMTHPEYCRPGEAERHRARVETMVRYASVVVANSEQTRKSFVDHFGCAGRVIPRCEVVPLGVESVFFDPPLQSRIEPAVPYFVVVGTIEPRKNLEFLLHVWRHWTSSGKAARARLVVVGRRGWENENIINMLERSAGLASSVIEVTSLSDIGMIMLLRGAAALLAPSMVEGFGLPIAESLTLGVPVIASDIGVFREVGGRFVEYIHPLDGRGWIAAFEEYARPNSERRNRQLALLRDYKPETWNSHVEKVETLLASRDSAGDRNK